MFGLNEVGPRTKEQPYLYTVYIYIYIFDNEVILWEGR